MKKAMDGDRWLYGFLKRYPELSLRASEKTSLARLNGLPKMPIRNSFDY